MARFENGWIKVYRKSILGDIGSSYVRQGLFNALIAIANLQASVASWNGKPRKINRGEIVTSLSELADLGGVDVKTVSRHLNYLQLRETISIEKCTTGTFIKIHNFDHYQGLDAEGSKRSPNGADDDVQTTGIHIEEVKKERKEELAYEQLFEIWNSYRKGLPKALSWSAKRRKAAKPLWTEFPDREFWIEVVKRIADSDFCNGRTGGKWTANFDFLIQADTHLKANEGQYDNPKKAANSMTMVS